MSKITYLVSAFFIIFYAQTVFSDSHKNEESKVELYFCTAADTQYFPWLMHLIGSMYQFHHVNDIAEIAIFDLGFTDAEIQELNSIEKVKVYDLEKANPYMLHPFKTRLDGKMARGWYTWKPVVLKQALELFPYFLYLDSGITIKGPLHNVFKHIKQHGYFLMDCGHSIKKMTTQYVIIKFNLDSSTRKFVLDDKSLGISAGIQGLTQALYNDYVKPIYELARNDITAFIDDGTAPEGFGWARSDQTIFSIYAKLLNLNVFRLIWDHRATLMVDGMPITFCMNDFLDIRQYIKTPENIEFMKQFIKYKKSKPRAFYEYA